MAEAIVKVKFDEEQMAVITGLADRLARVERLLVLSMVHPMESIEFRELLSELRVVAA
jgi:hypothetical protein